MSFEIKDLAGLSEPLKKLIEVISRGTGAITRPYLIRRTADAKAYEIRKVAEAIRENQKELKEIDYENEGTSLISIERKHFEQELSLDERRKERFEHQENKRQRNIEAITQKAAVDIEQDEKVSEENVDEDWTTRFFSYAQDVSEEEMQNLWAKILADEVRRPNSFSLRTLDLIRNLTKQEAQIINKAANFVVSSWDSPFLFRGEQNTVLEKFGLTFNDKLVLTELGIIQPGTDIIRKINFNINERSLFEAGKYLIRVRKNGTPPEIQIPIYRFTLIGEEVLQLLQTDPKLEYLKEFSEYFSNKDQNVDYALILKKENQNYTHTQPWQKF